MDNTDLELQRDVADPFGAATPLTRMTTHDIDPGRDDTPDGEAARGSGEGLIEVGEPIANDPRNPPRSDLQDDLGEDPTLIDEDSGD